MAAPVSITYYKNDGTNTSISGDSFGSVTIDQITSVGDNMMELDPGQEVSNWSRSGYTFLRWSTNQSGTGDSYSPGDTVTSGPLLLYAIWQVAADDVVISLGSTEIASMTATGTKTLATQGTYVTSDITVEYTKPSVSLQAKSNISPTTSSQTVTPDSGYDGLSSVQINAVPTVTLPTQTANSPIGTQRAAINPSTSVQYLNIGTGYNTAAKYYTISAMTAGSATTPSTTITANPSITVSSGGLITAVASATQSVTPTVSAGYVSSGTAGTITVSGSNTSQLTVYAGANHSSGYSITVSLINPDSPEAFESCEIYQINSNHTDEWNFYDDLTEIGTISSPTGSTVVLMSESAIGLAIGCSGSGMAVELGDGDVTTTGDVTFKPWSQVSCPPWPYVGMTDIYFEASGSGTITLSSINWDAD